MAQRAVLTDRLLKSLKPAPTGQANRPLGRGAAVLRRPDHRSWRDLVLRHAAHAGASRSRSASPWAAIPISVSPRRGRSPPPRSAISFPASIPRPASQQRHDLRRARRSLPLPPRRRQAAHRRRDQEDGRPVSPAALGQARRSAASPAPMPSPWSKTSTATSGPYTAAKALALASSIFRHAMTREQIASNPCTLIKITDFVGDMAPRQRVLTDAEIGLLWQATEDIYPAGPFARLLLLTAVRRSEAAHMTWGEVDLDDALWVVPASRTKSGVPHEVPLSRHGHGPAAVASSLHRRRLRVLDHRRPHAASAASASTRTQSMPALPGWPTGVSTICDGPRAPIWRRSASRRSSPS